MGLNKLVAFLVRKKEGRIRCKRKGQVLSVGSNTISIMDLESFETLDVACSEEIKGELEENSNVEYWDIEGQKIVKRKL